MHLMRRYIEIITEEIVHKERLTNGKMFVIVRNPSVQQFKTMLSQASEGLRGLIDETGLYVWDAYYADHDQIKNKLHIHSDSNLEFDAWAIMIDTQEIYYWNVEEAEQTTRQTAKDELAYFVQEVLTHAPVLVRVYPATAKVIVGVNMVPVTEDDEHGDSEYEDIEMGNLGDFSV